MRRFTIPEKVAIEAIGEATTSTGRGMRVLMSELAAGTTVDLDHADVTAGLAILKTALVAVGVWADDSTADRRIAEILT